MMWPINISFPFISMNQQYSTGESAQTKPGHQISADDRRLATTADSSLTTETVLRLQDSCALDADLLEMLVTSPSRSSWLQHLEGGVDDIEDDICRAEHPQVADSWGHFEFLEKSGRRPSAPDFTLECNCESIDIVEDDDKDDRMLIFQMEL